MLSIDCGTWVGTDFRVFDFFFFSSRRRHTRCGRDWSSDVCSSDLRATDGGAYLLPIVRDSSRLGDVQRIGTGVKDRIRIALGDVAAKTIDLLPPSPAPSPPKRRPALKPAASAKARRAL